MARSWLVLVACGIAWLPVAVQGEDAAAGGSTPTQAAPEAQAGDAAESSASDSGSSQNGAPGLAADPKIHPAGPIQYDRTIRDSVGTISVRPMPDAKAAVPEFFAQAEYLRGVQDNVMAAAYLEEIIANGDVTPPVRARAIIELADCLQAQQLNGEALCWLKIWMQLYPGRPEMGAVAYRVGTIYKQMGLRDMARDAYYLSLAHSINEGQVNSASDLKEYTELTVGTLWAMAANEYESGQWERAGELFDRFRKEAPSASAISQENAAYFQADCYYQLRQVDKAAALYEQTLAAHPFNPLALQARLRLYHLDLLSHQPEKARGELEALIWTVRTVCPQDERAWQTKTAQFLLAIHEKNPALLSPLVASSTHLQDAGKPWQDALHHYDAVVGYQAASQANMDSTASSSPTAPPTDRNAPAEQAELMAMDRQIDQVLPPPTDLSQ